MSSVTLSFTRLYFFQYASFLGKLRNGVLKALIASRLVFYHFSILRELWCWRRFLSPSDCKEIKPVNPKGNNPEYSLEGLMLKLQYFDHLMQRANSLKKTLMLGKIEDKRRKEHQWMTWLDSITL